MTTATGRILELCRSAHLRALGDQLEREAESMVISQSDPEAAEGIEGVLQRRSADFDAVRRKDRQDAGEQLG